MSTTPRLFLLTLSLLLFSVAALGQGSGTTLRGRHAAEHRPRKSRWPLHGHCFF